MSNKLLLGHARCASRLGIFHLPNGEVAFTARTAASDVLLSVLRGVSTSTVQGSDHNGQQRRSTWGLDHLAAHCEERSEGGLDLPMTISTCLVLNHDDFPRSIKLRAGLPRNICGAIASGSDSFEKHARGQRCSISIATREPQ